MKNSLLSDREVESLRAQVRQLRQSVAELEGRLAAFEGEASDEDRWGIWPYCYFVSGWNLGRSGLQRFGHKMGRWSLTRRNRRGRLQNDSIRELRLT